MSTAAPPSVPGPIVPPSPDDQHLHLLAIFYYISASLGLIGACLGLLYAAAGVGFLFIPDATDPDMPLEMVSAAMFGTGLCILIVSLASGVLQFMVGRSIGQRRHRIFCLVIGGLNCLSVPLGTILGVFTIIILVRPSVIEQFDQTAARTV